MNSPTLVIATAHKRNDPLEINIRAALPSYNIVRMRDKKELTLEMLDKLRPKLVFFPHWSWMIPQEIHARFECVIFHMTDVPYGRGGSPLQNLIVRGHRETMLSALKCVNDFDAGPVYMKRPLSLDGTAEEILQRASTVIQDMIVEIVEKRPLPVPQEGEVVEFRRRQPKDGNIAPLTELRQVYDFIRMLDADGYPAAFLTTPHFHVDFSQARLHEGFVEATVRIRKVDP